MGRASLLVEAASSAVNAYVLEPPTGGQAPASYFDQMEIVFRAATASTGSFTVQVGSLAAVTGAGGVVVGVNRFRYDSVTNTMSAVRGGGLGVGQTYQDLTASRALNTTYTNTTGQPIQVYVFCTFGAGAFDRRVEASIDGGASITLAVNSNTSGSTNVAGHITVPNGQTYRLTSLNTLSNWTELR